MELREKVVEVLHAVEVGKWTVADARDATLSLIDEERRALMDRTLKECPTCQGTGVMEVVMRVEAPDGHEVMGDAKCGECGGTGIGVMGEIILARDAAEARCAKLEEEVDRLRHNVQERRYIDMTPDDGMVSRILSAYIDESTRTDNTLGLPPDNPLCIAMNEAQAKRNTLLRAALAGVKEAAGGEKA